jgi:hypothetical protein
MTFAYFNNVVNNKMENLHVQQVSLVDQQVKMFNLSKGIDSNENIEHFSLRIRNSPEVCQEFNKSVGNLILTDFLRESGQEEASEGAMAQLQAALASGESLGAD